MRSAPRRSCANGPPRKQRCRPWPRQRFSTFCRISAHAAQRAGQPSLATKAEPRPETPAPQADIGALIAEAVIDAEAALEARLAVAHEAELEAERQASADEARVFLEGFGGDLGAAVAARIDAMEAKVSELVGATVARIIGGIVSDDLQKRSLEALAGTIREAVGDSEAVRIAVRGPLSLFETLKASLGDHARPISTSSRRPASTSPSPSTRRCSKPAWPNGRPPCPRSSS